MANIIKLNKGLNIKLKGNPNPEILNNIKSKLFAFIPDEFIGLIPKLLIKEGDLVKAGTPVFYDKNYPELKFASPVSGKLLSIVRGERRKILEIVIESDNKQDYLLHNVIDLQTLTKDSIINIMLETGLWPFIIQRPFGTIADHKQMPKAIYISGFDTAPLSPDLNFILKDEVEYLQYGINILSKIINNKINVGVSAYGNSIFENLQNVIINKFKGPHPAGNVGVQIHHITPINKGETVWTVKPEDVVTIGKLFIKGTYDTSRLVAITGSEVNKTGYVKSYPGAQISFIEKTNLTNIEKRIVSGNVLTGFKIAENGYLGFYSRQISVIPEGNKFEFLGWAKPGLKKFSFSNTFISKLFPKKEYSLNTNLNGGERAFVVSGQYEKVVPMDILPQHLVKAAIIGDIELMEKLGIYEVIEEDLALCEYVCTSKIEVQSIIRKALNLVKKELN